METQKQYNSTPEHIKAAREQRIAKIKDMPEKAAIQGLENASKASPAIQGLEPTKEDWKMEDPKEIYPEITPEQYALHAGISAEEAEKVLREAEEESKHL